jgi:hypothetical protein
MKEGSGSVSLTNGSGTPKYIWVLRIRIRNTAKYGIKRYEFSGLRLVPDRYVVPVHLWVLEVGEQHAYVAEGHSVITPSSQQVRYGTVPVHLWVFEVGEQHAYVAEKRLVASKIGEGGAGIHRLHQPQFFLLHTARRQGGGPVRCNIK